MASYPIGSCRLAGRSPPMIYAVCRMSGSVGSSSCIASPQAVSRKIRRIQAKSERGVEGIVAKDKFGGVRHAFSAEAIRLRAFCPNNTDTGFARRNFFGGVTASIPCRMERQSRRTLPWRLMAFRRTAMPLVGVIGFGEIIRVFPMPETIFCGQIFLKMAGKTVWRSLVASK